MMVTWQKKTSRAGSECLWGTEAWNALGHAVLWCCSFDLDNIRCRTFGLDVTRGESALELAGGCGGDQSFEVLMCGGPSPSSRWGGSSRWWWGRKSWLHFHKIYIWIAWVWWGWRRGGSVFPFDQFPCLSDEQNVQKLVCNAVHRTVPIYFCVVFNTWINLYFFIKPLFFYSCDVSEEIMRLEAARSAQARLESK